MSSAPEQLPDQVPVQHQPRKAACLALLIFAMVMTLAAFAEVGLARDGRIPAGLVGYGGGLAVLAGAAYYIQARFAPYADPLLLPLAVALNGLGLAMIYRLDLSTSKDVQDAIRDGKKVVTSGLASAGTQLQWTFVAILLFALTVLFLKDSKILQRYMYTLGACAIVLLLLPIVPGLGAEINGARVWIFIGPFSVQPGEFAKLLLVVFFAGYLVNKRQALSLVGKKIGPLSLPRARDLGPIMVIWLFGLGVLFIQKDLGTALLYFGLFVSMLYIATQRLSWVLIGVGMLALGVLVATQLPFLGHVNQRLSIWQNPDPYFDGGCLVGDKVVSVAPGTEPYIQAGNTIGSGLTACIRMGGEYADSAQLMKGLFALGEGGVLGKGLGQGEPWRTPLAFSDFIFDSMGEELGLTGLMVILLLYALIVQRGMKTAIAARDPFLKLFAGGVSFVLALQVFVIVGGVTRLIPLTGLTTPFLAQGGSSLMANWILIGILVRMSHQARQPAPQAIQDEGLTQVVSIR
ncbi:MULTISPECIES: FtsW/RodA/SpoVE family cell cycle protein [Thermomonospora]|uniref:Cell cycle protein n=1 Tax=Thermomonospora curvata (strain ATCC 19995 / DSM 43183 / JCM 3096 / KCTC 9072 / NBRC 15933 / NCIMB 10081 / Henssen B9) TaxID=471852 RepID=D1ADG4_THECD|nr:MULTISPECIES: FtsW/RodA/SpoVE family cell cycle protein [Thermomonospora]ACY95674.1 cell cycle protein [Thermomonospora curvata DSM 43183]PKK16267.1 MAG: FtsW/RodA/SpoVE family cell cycle protein [Thermomonospora sp. CIF 1]